MGLLKIVSLVRSLGLQAVASRDVAQPELLVAGTTRFCHGDQLDGLIGYSLVYFVIDRFRGGRDLGAPCGDSFTLIGTPCVLHRYAV